MDSDLGSYTCTVLDPIHLPVSANIAVVETSELYFVGGMAQRSVPITNGSDLVLDCPVRRGRGNVSVQWLKGTEQLRNDGRVAISSDGRQLILDTIILVDDMAVYTCRATDEMGSIELNFQVNVTGNHGKYARVELVWMREGELCIPLGVENRVVRFYNLISLLIPPPPLPSSSSPHTHTHASTRKHCQVLAPNRWHGWWAGPVRLLGDGKTPSISNVVVQ